MCRTKKERKRERQAGKEVQREGGRRIGDIDFIIYLLAKIKSLFIRLEIVAYFFLKIVLS